MLHTAHVPKAMLNQVRNVLYADAAQGRDPFARMYQRTDMYVKGECALKRA